MQIPRRLVLDFDTDSITTTVDGVEMRHALMSPDGVMAPVAGFTRAGADWHVNNPLAAMEEFLARRPDFVREAPPWPFDERLGLGGVPPATHCPDGWLRRVATESA